MPEIGPMEILVIAVVALIVFGPEKLPEMARKVGTFAADLRRMSNEVRSEYSGIMDDDEDDDDPFFPDDESSTKASKADEAGLPAGANTGNGARELPHSTDSGEADERKNVEA